MRYLLLVCATILISSILFLILAEGILRLTGNKPWTPSDRFPREPTIHLADPILGWKNKPGMHFIPAYDPAGKDIVMTFLEEGVRTTGSPMLAAGSELLIVGCSYAQGFAIDDDETFAWKLQRRYSSLKVLNFGTAGYGTYQSLLLLERELPRMQAPKIVLYGFLETHEYRNVAPADWLRILSKNPRRGHVEVPYATLTEAGDLVRHHPERYSSFPGRAIFALPAFIEKHYMRLMTHARLQQRRAITERLLSELKQVSEAHGARLVVAILQGTAQTIAHYQDFLHKQNILTIDCAFPLTADLQVPREGHPNGRMNALWESCIADGLALIPLVGQSENNSHLQRILDMDTGLPQGVLLHRTTLMGPTDRTSP
jgi:hypothetical protein